MHHSLKVTHYGRCLSVILIALGAYSTTAIASEQDCQITTDTSLVDYGRVTYEHEVRADKVILGMRDIRVTSVCPRTSSFALYFNGSKGEGRSFSFGPLGSTRVKVSSASVDGKPVTLSRINKDEQGREHVFVYAEDGVVPKNGLEESIGKVFSVTVTIAPRLDTKALSVRDSTHIESHIGLRLEALPLTRY